MAKPGAYQGLAKGVELASNILFKARDSQRLEDTLAADKGYKEREVRLKEMEFDLESGAGKLFNQTVNDDMAATKSRAAAGQVLQGMYDTAYKPKSLRDVDTLANVLKAQTGVELAPNVIDAFKKASTDELIPILHQVTAQYSDNPEIGMDQLGKVLSNPAVFNEAVSKFTKGALDAEQSVAAGQPPKRASDAEKQQKQIGLLENRRDKYMKIADAFPTTKHGQAAFMRAKEVQDRIDKMNGAGAGQHENQSLRMAATAAGIPASKPFSQFSTEEAGRANDMYKQIVMGQTVGAQGEIINTPVLRSQVGALAGTLRTPLKPLPQNVQDGLSQIPSMYRSMDAIEKALPKTGRMTGLATKAKIFLGKDREAIDADTALKNLKLQGQAIIKGIPSNRDASIMEETLSSFLQPESVNASRIGFTRRLTDDLLKASIAFHSGTGHKIPQNFIDLAKQRGIDLKDIKPWNGDVSAYPLDAVFDKYQPTMQKMLGAGKSNAPDLGKMSDEALKKALGL